MTTISQRIITILAASAFTVGLAAAPMTFAADAMPDAMHKPMKTKDSMHGRMTKKHGGAMMKKDAEPAQ